MRLMTICLKKNKVRVVDENIKNIYLNVILGQ